MIKVPATPAGIPAIEQLIGKGLSINVALLFARDNYTQAAEAYVAGLERFAADGGDVAGVASVASFFISRIDALIDAHIEDRLEQVEGASQRLALRALRGQAAVANAKLAYAWYRDTTAGERWGRLAARGARTQRLLWASTGVKNPAYRDVLYVEELIGPDTVNTLPAATLESFRDHGEARLSLEENLDEARDVMAALEELGISMQEATDKLQEDAVSLFVEPFAQLLEAIEKQGASTVRGA